MAASDVDKFTFLRCLMKCASVILSNHAERSAEIQTFSVDSSAFSRHCSLYSLWQSQFDQCLSMWRGPAAVVVPSARSIPRPAAGRRYVVSKLWWSTTPPVDVFLVLDVSSNRQGSIKWLVCICCGYNVMTLLGLIEFVSLFRTSTLSLCWYWGWSLTGCLSSSVVLLRPKLKWDRY